MCSAFQFRQQTFRPGTEVLARSPLGLERLVWAGFAKKESLAWWTGEGGVLLDLPADRFAERSDMTGRLIWSDIPVRCVLRGLMDRRGTSPLLKIVTRASTLQEIGVFQHPRMPFLEEMLYGDESWPDLTDGFENELF